MRLYAPWEQFECRKFLRHDCKDRAANRARCCRKFTGPPCICVYYTYIFLDGYLGSRSVYIPIHIHIYITYLHMSFNDWPIARSFWEKGRRSVQMPVSMMLMSTILIFQFFFCVECKIKVAQNSTLEFIWFSYSRIHANVC